MLTSSVFWGLILVITGGLYILRDLFGLDIPIWNTLWPLFLILFGIKVLLAKKTK